MKVPGGHVVRLVAHVVGLVLYWPSAHTMQPVSSRVFSAADPATNFSVGPQTVRFVLHEAALFLYEPSGQAVHTYPSLVPAQLPERIWESAQMMFEQVLQVRPLVVPVQLPA